MNGLELFGVVLLVLGWIIFQVVRRVLKPPRPLGTIRDERPPRPALPEPPRQRPAPAREAPLDTHWGRAPAPAAPALPPPVASEPFRWSVDAAQAELETAREVARRQARARLPQPDSPGRSRHPHRPRLRSTRELRDAVVLVALLGPCRAQQPWEPPEPSAADAGTR